MTRKFIMLLGLVFAVSASPVMAADLANFENQSCGDATGDWHFVLNNIPGSYGLGTLTATFSGDPATCTDVGNYPGKTKDKSTQHFYCNGFPGALHSASTDIPGNLRLSQFSCDSTCVPEKEVCDGKDNDCNGKIDDGITCKP